MPAVESQPVETPLTRSAIFIVVTVHDDDAALNSVRQLFGDLASIIRGVSFRNPDAQLTGILGIGAALWDRLGQPAKPAGLHELAEINGVHHAPSTPGDILFHIRAERQDFCFELARQIMDRLRGAVTVEDETDGFKFFDNRDLLGFVDGTENPAGQALHRAVVIGAEDPAFAGGSYVITQKYIHDMTGWDKLSVEDQERIIGRHKLSDIEFPDDQKAPFAHNVLTNINDAEGNQLQILRDNMPFGSPSRPEFGTYFIGYACEPTRTERMLNNMFVGDPPGNYDHILDFSMPVTGSLFFVPSADLLAALADPAPAADPFAPHDDPARMPDPAPDDGSLGIGSLKRRS